MSTRDALPAPRVSFVHCNQRLGEKCLIGAIADLACAIVFLSTPAPVHGGSTTTATPAPSPNLVGTGTVKMFVQPTGLRTTLEPSVTEAVRSRWVDVDYAAMSASNARVGDLLDLNFFNDANFAGVVEKVDRRSPDRVTLSGHVVGQNTGTFVLVRHDAAVVGEVHVPGRGTFTVRKSSTGAHVVSEIDDGRLAPCGSGAAQAPTVQVKREVAAPGPGGQTTYTADQNYPVVDVLVVYTPAARTSAGGHDAMQANAQMFVSAMNTTFQNSLVNARARLVYAGEIAYTESNNASTDLSRLTNQTDGFMDNVHALRNQYGADMVSLMVNSFNACGIAWLFYGADRAFSVVDYGCGASTFVHELCHNMGCAHDRSNTPPAGQYSYSYGHRFAGLSGQQYRTVMAYYPGTRILHLSNPDVYYDGVPTGVPVGSSQAANNALTVNNTVSTVAEYRPAADMVDCNGNFRADSQDVLDGTSGDCNGNTVPDECDVGSGDSADANGNNVPDECECNAAVCIDNDPCTVDSCDPNNGACVHQAGGVPYGDLNNNGRVDVEDIDCALNSFIGVISGCASADVFPCGGDGTVDIDDLITILDAFSGTALCPSPCP